MLFRGVTGSGLWEEKIQTDQNQLVRVGHFLLVKPEPDQIEQQ